MSIGQLANQSHPPPRSNSSATDCCQGADTRQIRGGALAIIHPRFPEESAAFDAGIACKLYLQTVDMDGASQNVMVIRRNGVGSTQMDDIVGQCEVLIHEDGDLQRSGCVDDPVMAQFPILHETALRIGQVNTADDAIITPISNFPFNFDIAQTGTPGLIGRRVSFVYHDGRVAGDGIIGWN